MLIVCPSCASEYTIAPEHIGPDGRTVRCAACREPWFVPPEAASPGAAETAAAGHEPAPAAGRSVLRRPAPGIRRSRSAPLAAALAVVLAAGAVLAREPVVRGLPRTATLYAALGLPVNLRGLALEDVAAHQVPAGSGSAGRLVVEGDVVAVAADARPVPAIAVEIRDAGDRVLYRWTTEPPRDRMEPRERARFRAELSSPPAGGRRVLIRFATVDTVETPVSLAAASPRPIEVR
ncbi:MAG: zinc-ribbon domain-containing protein [Methylobacterium frigidaeris]